MRRSWIVSLLLGPAICALVVAAPLPEGLTPEGKAALGVLLLCMTWWLFTPVALPVTSLVGMALLPTLGVLPASEAMSLFGNQAVFFVIGVFLVAAALMQTGLSTRVAVWGLSALSRGENALCYAVLFLSFALCAVVVSHAVAALMLPLVLELIRALELGPRSRTARRLLLSMAWGTVCGSNLTLNSSARASLARELYAGYRIDSGLAPDPITFLEFTLGSAPLAFMSVLLCAMVLRLSFPPEGLDLKPAMARLQEKVDGLGPVSQKEYLAGLVVIGMLVGALVFGSTMGLGTVALLGSGTLFATRVLSWDDAERYVNWGVALLYGGAIAVGAALDRTGAAPWLVEHLVPNSGFPPWVYFMALALLAAAMTEVVSNAAVIAILLPVGLHLANSLGLEPRSLVWLLSICAGFSFALPTSTPAMAMVYGTGYIATRDTVLQGIFLITVSAVLFVLTANWIWPVVGLHISAGAP